MQDTNGKYLSPTLQCKTLVDDKVSSLGHDIIQMTNVKANV